MKRKILISGLCVMLILSGCGEKTPETVEDYGGTSSEAKEEARGLVTFPRTYENPYETDEPQVVYEETFAAEDVPVEIHLKSVTWDTDQTFVRPVQALTRDRITEDKLVRDFFGGTETKVDRTLEDRDPFNLGDIIRAFMLLYQPDSVSATISEYGLTTYEFSGLPTWEDGSDYFFHTWEGKHDGVDYWLFLGWREDLHSEYIRFYPKNPGELIGDATYSEMSSYNSRWGGLSLADGREINDILEGVKNRTEMSDKSLREMASEFAEKTLHVHIPLDDITFSGDDTRDIVYYTSPEIEESERYDKALVDGYLLRSKGMHINYGIATMDMISFMGKNQNSFIDNKSEVYIHDAGVVAGDYCVAYLPTDDEETALLLNFNHLLSAFRGHLTDNIDHMENNNQKITCDTMRLIYYPVQSKTDKLDYTYIPTWRIELRRNDYYPIATMFLNAIDGSLIEIQYPETE